MKFTNPFYEFKERLELTNYVFRVHHYGLEYLGLKERNFDPARFEWIVKEKERSHMEPVGISKTEETMRSRQANLGC